MTKPEPCFLVPGTFTITPLARACSFRVIFCSLERPRTTATGGAGVGPDWFVETRPDDTLLGEGDNSCGPSS